MNRQLIISKNKIQQYLYLTILLSILLLQLILGGSARGDCTPPPVAQSIGITDNVILDLTESECRQCHGLQLSNRHHILYESTIPDPTVSPFGVPGEHYSCLSCHEESTSGSVTNFLVERDCSVCHVQNTPDLSVHHQTALAQGTLPQGPDCKACHGSLVENKDDGHFISAEPVFMSTPKRSSGAGLPYNSRGNGAGACNYCHDDGTTCTDSILVETSRDTHHNIGFGTDAEKCSWCHDFSLPFNEQIRVCENCHGRDSLHNIQLDSDNDSIINPGAETTGFGHIGDPDDCWGCHGYGAGATASYMAASPGDGPVTPYINSVNPTILFSGTSTLLTITGTAFINISQGTELFSNIVVTDENGTDTILVPETITESIITVTISSSFLPGSYTLRALKLDKYSNPKVLTIKPAVIITSASIRPGCGSCTGDLTINGYGFGPSPPPGTELFYHVKQDGVTLPTTTWTDTLIKATGAVCDGESITVKGFYGSATYPLK